MILKSIEIERESRMQFMRDPDGSVQAQFETVLSNGLSLTDKKTIADAWVYAQSLDYDHPGQNKAAYLAHPLRVATLCAQLVSPINVKGIVTSLLHNVQELSDVTEADIAAEVGVEVADAISVLTVDRSMQWDDDYKQEYYRKIANAGQFVQQVKVLDKLDNMFLLCLNPSDEIRALYLREIEKWLLPIAKQATPDIESYLQELIENNRIIGHKPLSNPN